MKVRLPASVTHTWKLRQASRKVADDIYEKAMEAGRKSAERYGNKYITDVFSVACWTLYKDYGWGEGRIVQFLARCSASSHDVLDQCEMPDGSADVIRELVKRMGIDVDRILERFAGDAGLARKAAQTANAGSLRAEDLLDNDT